jgi:D-alanyl-D-alanine carboxypeptidase (penicillin-binding protein 5/6)
MKLFCRTQIKRRFSASTIVLALLFLADCYPAGLPEPAIATPVPPPATATPTSVPTSTSTPTPTATPTLTPTVTVTPTQIPTATPVQPDLRLAAGSAVLIDTQTGDILYDKNAHQRMFPASTTKIMTALLALEYFKPDEIILVGDEVNLAWTKLRLDSQKAGLFYLQKLSMKELLYGLLLDSGSDAAFVIAVHVARRESDDDFMPISEAVEHFIALMNERARALGAVGTNFINPDGYHDPNHYTTAYDLALIAQQAMQDPLFREIVATHLHNTVTVGARNGSFPKSWANTNRLIDPHDERYYASANGIKTGTTGQAGYCLVSSAKFEKDMVIAVVLDSTQEGVWSDSVTLLDYAKDNLQ